MLRRRNSSDRHTLVIMMKANNNYHPISGTLHFGQDSRIPTGYVVYSVLFYHLNIYFHIDADYFPFKVPGF